MDASALEVAGLSKRYDNRSALDDVHLSVPAGRLHGLLGPNGAGKTTLIRICLGLIRRDAGSVRLLGSSLDDTGGVLPSAVAGFVETPGFYPYLSGRTNLALLARLDGSPRSPRSLDGVLDQVALTAHADRAVGHYSTGMRQRLGLAASLLRSPRLLFLDEPTSSLDPAAARATRTLVRSLANDDVAIVFSSHDLAEVEELCSDITIINHGRVVYSGRVDELRARAPVIVHVLQTSHNLLAREVAARHSRIRTTLAADGTLEITGSVDAVDAYVIALAYAGVAVRTLDQRARSLESLFLELTGAVDSPTRLSPAAASLAS